MAFERNSASRRDKRPSDECYYDGNGYYSRYSNCDYYGGYYGGYGLLDRLLWIL